MGASSTARSRPHRERQRAGRALITIEIDPIATSELLIDYEILPAWDAEDRGAISRALTRLIDLLIVRDKG